MFLGPFETQTASSVITCQSGVPGTGNTAAGVMVVISRFTPGVLTPGRGGRFGRSFFSCGRRRAVLPEHQQQRHARAKTDRPNRT